MTIETGALEQAYVDLEASYAVTPAGALSATDAIRHAELSLTGKTNREPSPAKRGTPDETQSLPRRFTAGWNLSSICGNRRAPWAPRRTSGSC
jgi:hypothetical protein